MVLGADIKGKPSLSIIISDNLVKDKNLNAGTIVRDWGKRFGRRRRTTFLRYRRRNKFSGYSNGAGEGQELSELKFIANSSHTRSRYNFVKDKISR